MQWLVEVNVMEMYGTGVRQHLLTYLLTQWSRVLLEKQIGFTVKIIVLKELSIEIRNFSLDWKIGH